MASRVTLVAPAELAKAKTIPSKRSEENTGYVEGDLKVRGDVIAFADDNSETKQKLIIKKAELYADHGPYKKSFDVTEEVFNHVENDELHLKVSYDLAGHDFALGRR